MISLLLKTLSDKRWFIVGWGLGLMFLGYLMAIFFPTFKGGDIAALMESIPKALQALLGDLAVLSHVDTYLASELYAIRLPMFVSIMAIILGLSLSVGEEDAGLTRTYLAMPLSRASWFFQKITAAAITLLLPLGMMVFGALLGLWQIGESIELIVLFKLTLLSLLFVYTLFALTFSIGAATGRRSVTLLLAIVVAVGSFILSTFSTSVEWLKPYEAYSLLHYFPSVDLAQGEMSGWYWLVGITISLVSLCVALLLFRRRDIAE